MPGKSGIPSCHLRKSGCSLAAAAGAKMRRCQFCFSDTAPGLPREAVQQNLIFAPAQRGSGAFALESEPKRCSQAEGKRGESGELLDAPQYFKFRQSGANVDASSAEKRSTHGIGLWLQLGAPMGWATPGEKLRTPWPFACVARLWPGHVRLVAGGNG